MNAMKATQLTMFDISEQRETFSPFRLMQRATIDDVFCIVGKAIAGLIGVVGIAVIMCGAVGEARRQERIEEVIYKRREDDDLLDEAMPDLCFLSKKTISKNQRKMIVREQIRKKWKRERMWRREIEKQINRSQK